MSSTELNEEVIFNVAREIGGADARDAYLREACGADGALRQRVQLLLNAYLSDGDFLESPVNAFEDTEVQECAPDLPGTIIGPYKLLEQIGSGGMGIVYRAEQQSPVTRMVALKIIRPGMDTRHVVNRFEAERQVLAMMDHPNIARMLDAGTTENGRPYFVMELVRGIMITRHCDEAGLTLPERLRLFLAVCEGVQHAHQNGIIHRDIKPHNVLVTLQDGQSIPKVIDFGVAKATTPRRLGWTEHSQTVQMVGTPIYMSPEQARLGRTDVDTRSDVYSLGALLYELLTGVPPFTKQRMQEVGYDEMLRMIREVDPLRPSLRAAEQWATRKAAAGLGNSSASHPSCLPSQQLLRDDLDWIVMKALEKDRELRYRSVSVLAADIRRYLADTPVEARRPSTVYRLRKFARRRRSLFWLMSTVVLFGMMALGALVSSYVLVARERTEMLRQRNIAQDQAQLLLHREETIRRYLYASELQLAYLAWQRGDLNRTRTLLTRQVPDEGQADLRGFEWHYLQRLVTDPVRVLPGHQRNVFDVKFSPDGESLTSCSGDYTARFWSVRDGRETALLSDFSNDANALRFTPDGAMFVTAEEDRAVRVWTSNPRRPVARLTDFAGPVAQASLSRDGKSLVTTEVVWDSMNVRVDVWNWNTGERLAALPDQRMLAHDVARDRILTIGSDKQLGLWELPELTLQHRWNQEQAVIECGSFSPDGAFVATAGRDGIVRIWSTADRSFRQLPSIGANQSRVLDLEFLPDGHFLATAAHDGTTRIWDLRAMAVRRVIRNRSGYIWSIDISPDGANLAIGCEDGTVELHAIHDLKDTFRRNGEHRFTGEAYPEFSLAVDRQHSHFARITEQQEKISVHECQSGAPVTTISLTGQKAQSVALDPDGRTLWCGSQTGNLLRFDITNGQQISAVNLRETRSIERLLISADGRTIVTDTGTGTGGDVGIRVWKAGTSELIRELSHDPSGHRDWPHLIYGISETNLLCAVQGRHGFVWDLDRSTELRPRLVDDSWTYMLTVSPDGKLAFSGTDEGTITVWEVATGRQVGQLLGHGDVPTQLTVSSDGRTLASGGSHGTVKLWNVSTLQILCDLQGLAGHCRMLSFSPDGSRLFGAGENGKHSVELVIWDTGVIPSPPDISKKVREIPQSH